MVILDRISNPRKQYKRRQKNGFKIFHVTIWKLYLNFMKMILKLSIMTFQFGWKIKLNVDFLFLLLEHKLIIQASMNEDGRLRTVHPFVWTTDQNLCSDCPSDKKNRRVIFYEWTKGSRDRLKSSPKTRSWFMTSVSYSRLCWWCHVCLAAR